MSVKLEISAGYAATDGGMPESVNVVIEADDATDIDIGRALTILELLLSAPAQRPNWRAQEMARQVRAGLVSP